jgi:hypothetical protein
MIPNRLIIFPGYYIIKCTIIKFTVIKFKKGTTNLLLFSSGLVAALFHSAYKRNLPSSVSDGTSPD